MRAVNRWYLGGSLAVVASMLGAGTVADAGTLSTTVPVTMNLVESCSGFSAGTASLGSLQRKQAAQAPSTSTQVSVSCANGAAWQIVAQASTDTSQSNPDYHCAANLTQAQGKLVNSNNAPTAGGYYFSVYKDSNFANELGTTPSCGGATALTGTGSGTAQAVPLYVKVVASGGGDDSPLQAGTYSSSFTLILSF